MSERVEFSGGGVRDVESDKPRFDLLRPLAVPYEHQMLTRWARHMAWGADKYAPRNWELMNDLEAYDRFKSSAARHFEQWFTGVEDGEDHAAAVFFNIQGAEYVQGRMSGEY